MVDLVSLAISVVVGIIILSPVLWLVGRWLVGKEKAKFTDAILIVVIGLVVNAIIGWILTGWLSVIGWIVMLIVWLYLIKHFFDCGWLKALLIAIVAVIVFIIIGVVLALIGFAVFSLI
jgi:small-conductance mechanosensitive channel